ncbi:MAG: hypothetical protein IKT81_06075 [Clostridia bacterium]|nr:hypothetical protein [Clostridia bacterium]
MRSIHRILSGIMCAVLVFCAVFAAAPEARAITTVFMVPPISPTYVHHNTLYLSPNYNITALSWGYGTTVDILNTTGDIDSLLSEVFANVTPKGGERIMGIYMEGAGLSDKNAADIAAAGWTKMEMYYETYMVACPPVGATHPDIQLVTNARIDSVLKGAGFDEQFAVLEVSGVNSTWAYLIKYDASLSFLRGKDVKVYKYLVDLGVFVEVEEVYFDSYDRNFLEWDHPQLVEADMNGLYVAVGQALPQELVYTAQAAADLRATPPVVSNTEGNVQWKMSPGLVPDNFTAEAVITPAADSTKTELSVDFAYSGELPEGTEVTLTIPQDTVSYVEGTELFLYYCNPDSQLREFVSSAVYNGGAVTFAIYHCSEYIVTDTNYGESYMPEPDAPAEPEVPAEPLPSVPAPMPSVEIDPAEIPSEPTPEPELDEPLYALPLKSPNYTAIISAAAAAVAVIAAAAVIIVKKKKK